MDIIKFDRETRWTSQQVKITFADDLFRAEKIVEVGGNGKGFDVLETAVEAALEELTTEAMKRDGLSDDDYDEIIDEGNYLSLELTLSDLDGNTLLCCSDGEDPEDWLKELIISLEIVSVTPE
jgi:hypothetical protein